MTTRRPCSFVLTCLFSRKSQYDSTALQLQSNMNKLEVEVRTMRDEILTAESRYFTYST